MVEYQDTWIACTDEGIRIRGYYFPWGTKRVPYGKIRSVQRVTMTAMRGKARIWGTANPRYWASLDPKRSRKTYALILDLGRFVRPFITPDDCDAVEAIIKKHANLGDGGGRAGQGPIV